MFLSIAGTPHWDRLSYVSFYCLSCWSGQTWAVEIAQGGVVLLFRMFILSSFLDSIRFGASSRTILWSVSSHAKFASSSKCKQDGARLERQTMLRLERIAFELDLQELRT